MLHYREQGETSQETIVLLHGGGLSGSMWEEVMQELAGYHCIAPDLPEHGGSKDCGPLTADHCAAELMELLQGRDRIHLVGLSLGERLRCACCSRSRSESNLQSLQERRQAWAKQQRSCLIRL